MTPKIFLKNIQYIQYEIYLYAPIGANTQLYIVHLDGVSGRFFSIRGNLGPLYPDIIDGIFGSYSKNEIII